MDKKRKNVGSTMVEVLVGFALLMILMAGLSHLINMSSEMVFNTKDTMNEQKSFLEEFYKDNHGSLSESEITSDGLRLIETDSSGNSDKTDGVTVALENTGIRKISDDESGLSVYQIYKVLP